VFADGIGDALAATETADELLLLVLHDDIFGDLLGRLGSRLVDEVGRDLQRAKLGNRG
jgi:hypothetical protein